MRVRQLAWLGLMSFGVSGCILDDNHCGENQVEVKDLFEGCGCAPTAVPNANGVGCHLCGANEVAMNGACACAAGYSRPAPTAACAMPADTGTPVDAGGSADAGGGADAGTAAAPTGQGASCTTSADCAGFDATYCITLQPPNQCLVQGCATGASRCTSDRDCCDFGSFAALASTNGLCVPTGTCPAGIGRVVTP